MESVRITTTIPKWLRDEILRRRYRYNDLIRLGYYIKKNFGENADLISIIFDISKIKEDLKEVLESFKRLYINIYKTWERNIKSENNG